MNCGSFFRLSLETSKVVSGITYYDYIDVPDLDARDDELRYPIKISISPTDVSFFVHYYKRDSIPHHIEDLILRLPYKEDGTGALSSIVKHVYNTTFPLSEYLEELLKSRYPGSEDKKDNRYERYQRSQINRNSYSSLYIWGLLRNQEGSEASYQIGDNNSDKITRFLRKLLLDFMFDMMHSDVFESSKYYLQMRESLLNDFFFSSIVKKCEYYYYRRLIRARFKNEVDKETLRKLYAEHFDAAERAWTEAIMSPLAEKHFAFSPEWFEDKKHTQTHSDFTVSDSWFVDPEEEMSRIVFPLNNPDTKKKFYLNSYELSKYIGAKNNSSVIARNEAISKWFYRRFDFVHTFRMHMFHGGNTVFTTALMLLITFCIVSFLMPELSLWSSPIYIAIIPAIIGLLFLLYGIWFVIAAVRIGCKPKKDRRIDDILVCSRREEEAVRSMTLSINLSFVALLIPNEHLCPWCIIALLMTLAVSLLIRFRTTSARLINSLHLLLPRLVASITTAWIMLVIGNDLVKEHVSVPLCVIITLVVFLFILYESNKVLPKTRKLYLAYRSLELMLISFSIAFVIGIFAIDVLSPSLMADALNAQMTDGGQIPYIMETVTSYKWTFLGWELTIFPTYLIQFSFLAMFIGVFIQMIFEDKSITEM